MGRQAAVAWRSISSGVPTRAENSPGGELRVGEARRLWQGYSWGRVRCCGGPTDRILDKLAPGAFEEILLGCGE